LAAAQVVMLVSSGGGPCWILSAISWHRFGVGSRVHMPQRVHVALHAATRHRCDAGAQDPWAVLGLPKTADRAMVKARYYKLVRAYHPDLQGECASQSMMQCVILATEMILAGLRLEPDEQAPGPTISRVEKMWRQREKEMAQQGLNEIVIYTGRSRLHRAQYCEYRILRNRIELTWALGRFAGNHRRSGGQRIVKFPDIRCVSGQTDQRDNLVDLELELLIGSRIMLEQLPQDVANQVANFVRLEQFHRQVLRERRLGRN